MKTLHVFICILILEYYGPNIEYIRSDKNIVANALSRFPMNRNQETTKYFTHKFLFFRNKLH